MNKLLAAGGILALLGGLALLIMPGPPVPLLDANRQVLAQSERAGYCVGEVYYRTRGEGSEESMNDCMATSSVDNTIDHQRVQYAFCVGLNDAGFNMPPPECDAIMKEQQFWPTMKGALTNAWNRRFPYPGDFITSNVPDSGGESRTGERETTDREGFSR